MKTLAEDIIDALPRMLDQHAKGPCAADIARVVQVPVANVRAAMGTIKAQGLAIIVRYPGSKARHVVPLDHDFGIRGLRAKACRRCDAIYQSSNRLYCSKKCSAAHRWEDPEYKARVGAAISVAQRTPEQLARNAAHNKRPVEQARRARETCGAEPARMV